MNDNSLRQPGSASEAYSQEDIDLCREGDRKALHKVLMAHSAQLEAILRRSLRDDAEVADALQKTLIAAVGAFPQFRGAASVRSWLTGIALNIARNHIRQTIRTRERFSPDPESLDVIPSRAMPPDFEAEEQQQHARIRHHIGRLAPKLREAYLLHIVDGFTLRELGEVLKIPQMTVKSRVFHAKRQLKEFVKNDPILRDSLAAKGSGGSDD